MISRVKTKLRNQDWWKVSLIVLWIIGALILGYLSFWPIFYYYSLYLTHTAAALTIYIPITIILVAILTIGGFFYATKLYKKGQFLKKSNKNVSPFAVKRFRIFVVASYISIWFIIVATAISLISFYHSRSNLNYLELDNNHITLNSMVEEFNLASLGEVHWEDDNASPFSSWDTGGFWQKYAVEGDTAKDLFFIKIEQYIIPDSCEIYTDTERLCSLIEPKSKKVIGLEAFELKKGEKYHFNQQPAASDGLYVHIGVPNDGS